jgi:hypothetical protein
MYEMWFAVFRRLVQHPLGIDKNCSCPCWTQDINIIVGHTGSNPGWHASSSRFWYTGSHYRLFLCER